MPEREPDMPETAWKSQAEEETGGAPPTPSPERLCAMARSRERLHARLTRAILAAMVVLAGVFLYNVYRVDQPWIRLGQVWTLGVVVYLFGPALDGTQRKGAGEPCTVFLTRHHDERRRGYLRIRGRLFLFLPGIGASWWGGGPAAAAKARGLDPSSRLFHFLAGPWPFLLALTALGVVWLALGKAAEKAAHDRDEIDRGIAQ